MIFLKWQPFTSMKPALPSMQMYEGHRSRKMHSLKAHCRWLLSHPSTLFFLSPLFVLQILRQIIPSCTAARAHPSTTHAAALNANVMAATNALLQAQPEPFLFSLLFLPFFSSFLSSLFFSPVGKCNEMITRIQKKEVTHWLWK